MKIVFTIALSALIIADMLTTVLLIEKPRETITHKNAALSVISDMILLFGIYHFYL